jgi:hypothetical protein
MSDDLVSRLRVEPTASHFLKPAHLYQDLIAERAEAANRIQADQALIQEMREALEWMIENDETNEGDEPLADHGYRSWNEINAYWIEGLNKARATLSKAKSQQEGETE